MSHRPKRKIMNFKKLSRIIGVTALTCVAGLTGVASGCAIETNHPRARITIEFLDETYEIDYNLYRNMYPQTVKRFIELADQGFYDNTIIHDYTANDWYAGGYGYDESYETAYASGAMEEYYENFSLQDEFVDLFENSKLTTSVYRELGYNDKDEAIGVTPLATLYGEFKNNNHKVKSGALSNEFGALHMYYVSNATSKETVVGISGSGEVLERSYNYNCATSMFAIQANTSSSLAVANYCVFAVLDKESDEDVLFDLQEAIEEYIDDNLNGTTADFTKTKVTATVNDYDQVLDAGSLTKLCSATIKPLIIKSVKITKY